MMIVRVDLFIYELGFVVQLFAPAPRGTLPAAWIESGWKGPASRLVAGRSVGGRGLFLKDTKAMKSGMRQIAALPAHRQTIAGKPGSMD